MKRVFCPCCLVACAGSEESYCAIVFWRPRLGLTMGDPFSVVTIKGNRDYGRFLLYCCYATIAGLESNRSPVIQMLFAL